MTFWEKVREIHLEKKRVFKVMLAVEALVFFLAVIGLFGKNDVYFVEQELAVDESAGVQTYALAELALPRGAYEVSLHYTTDTNMKNLCTVVNNAVGYRSCLSNGEHLYAGLDKTDFMMWLFQNTEHLQVKVDFGGEGNLSISGVTVTETNALNRIFVFLWLVAALLVNVAYIYWKYDEKYQIPLKNKIVTLGLGAVILVSSIPLMVDYMLPSGDLVYHLMRIEGIKDGLLSGQFPVRIAPEWQQGYGYASSIFYGETVLYLAALFRMTGFTVVTSYRMFMFCVNVATVLVAYYSFWKIFGEKYIGLLCSTVYSLSIYRLFHLYGKGSFGEVFGVLFLPLLVYGFYRVFTMDVEDVSYKRSWIPLTVGFVGLIQSHILSTYLAAGFSILLCVLLWKKVFRRQTFVVLAKTVVYSSLLSAWFLVPFFDYMLTGNFTIQNVSGRTIQERGIYLGNLFQTFVVNGTNPFPAVQGMMDGQAYGVGMALMGALLCWMALVFLRKHKRLDKKDRTAGWLMMGFSIMAVVMSLNCFPWDAIQFRNRLTATLVSSIQFPYRILTIAAVCLTFLAGLVAKCFLQYGKKQICMVYMGASALLVILGSVWLMDNMLQSLSPCRIYNAEGMGSGYIAGAEYLPYGADASQYMPRAPLAEDNMIVEGYEKSALTVDVTCFNDSDREGALEMPLVYYKGYGAYDLNTGERLNVYDGTNHVVGVAVPAGYGGTLRVTFQSPWYWRVAEGISVVSFVGLLGAGIMAGKGGQCGQRIGREKNTL